MWEAVRHIATGFSLVAFLVAAVVTLLRRRLLNRERQLLAAPEHERPALVEALNDAFLIPALPIDPKALTAPQQYSLLLEQLQARSKRFYATSLLILALAILGTGVTILAVLQSPTTADPFSARVSVEPGTFDLRELLSRLGGRQFTVLLEPGLETELSAATVTLSTPLRDVPLRLALDRVFVGVPVKVEYSVSGTTVEIRRRDGP
jgi:hypothetical protein